MRRALPIVITLVLTPVWGSPAAAEAQPAPEGADGRYTFNRAGEGYLRLDTRTGQVSMCTRRAVGWACQLVPDERTVLEAEMARIQSENAALKKQMLANNVPLPDGMKADPPPPKSKSVLRVPTEEEMREAASFMRRTWLGLVEMMSALRNDVFNKGSP